MIIKIKQWCEGIIVAVIISIIIEMIIPDDKNKKYIKVVIGVYIMIVSLSPFLEILNYDFELKSIENTLPTSTYSFNDDVKEVYILGIESSLKSEIENLGYDVDDIKIYLDINYENIEKVELKVNKRDIEIDPIVIKESNESQKYEDIVELINNNYFVDSDNIIFK